MGQSCDKLDFGNFGGMNFDPSPCATLKWEPQNNSIVQFDIYLKLWVEVIVVTFLDAVAT